jgi:hypothetical protein
LLPPRRSPPLPPLFRSCLLRLRRLRRPAAPRPAARRRSPPPPRHCRLPRPLRTVPPSPARSEEASGTARAPFGESPRTGRSTSLS